MSKKSVAKQIKMNGTGVGFVKNNKNMKEPIRRDE
jgi:hypothetical protein